MLLRVVAAAACVVAVLAHLGTEQCSAPKVSAVSVSLRSTRNATGHWHTQVVPGSVRVDFGQDEPGDVPIWIGNVEQHGLTCGDQESTLDTIVQLKGSGGRERRRRTAPSNPPSNSACPCPCPFSFPPPFNRHMPFHSHQHAPFPFPPPKNHHHPPPFPARGGHPMPFGMVPYQFPQHQFKQAQNPAQPGARQPPPGYELFPGVGYYKFHPERLSWPNARQACSTEGGHLIILNSEAENEVAKQIYARYPKALNWFMAGIQELGVNGKYYTVFGQPLETTGFTRFKAGQPNARGPNDYGGMHRTGEYADHEAFEKLAFICEFDL